LAVGDEMVMAEGPRLQSSPSSQLLHNCTAMHLAPMPSFRERSTKHKF
jgi:hypothetical protein